MKTAILGVAVFAVWFALIALKGWLLPRKEKSWEQMEDMMNEGCQTTILLVGLGLLSVVIVLACAIAFEFV